MAAANSPYIKFWVVRWAMDCADALKEWASHGSSSTGRKRGKGAVELHILTTIARHSNDIGECFLSYETLAAEANLSKRTCIRAVSNLRKASLIEVLGQHRSGANRFRLLVVSADESDSETPPQCPQDTSDSGTLPQ